MPVCAPGGEEMRTVDLIVLGIVGALAGACGTDDGRASSSTAATLGSQTTTGTGGTGSTPGATTSAAETDPAGSATSAAASEGGVLFDLPPSGGGDSTGAVMGCRNVDFLFVIDNSVSMEDNQAALVGAFPGFMSTIQTTLDPASQFQILVADTDEWGRCNTDNPWSGMDPSDDTCNNYIRNTVFEECDRVRGAGVNHPAGQHASNAPCNFASGTRFIDSTEPDLGAAFSCAATVGAAGHPSERPMESMVAALSPALASVGGCNEGFLRDDALLVVSFLSDDPNKEDEGVAMDWYQAVVDAKGGDPTAVVVLGLTPAWEGCRGADAQPHWVEFIELWGDQGLHGDICGGADDYVSFFESAVSTIAEACDNFEPPG